MTWKKFTAYQSSPSASGYPDLPEDVTYLRLLIGLLYGISLGYRESNNDISLKGGIGVMFGLNVIAFLPILYMNFYLTAETDTYKALNFAGVPNGLALMLLTWIIFFTMLNEEVEMELNTNAVIKAVVNATLGDGAIIEEEVSVLEESEF